MTGSGATFEKQASGTMRTWLSSTGSTGSSLIAALSKGKFSSVIFGCDLDSAAAATSADSNGDDDKDRILVLLIPLLIAR